MITGLLIGLFSLAAIEKSVSRTEIIGFSFLILTGFFLALVGVFHEGTYPHVFLAEWFFLLGKISFLLIGISLILQKFRISRVIMFIFNIIAWIVEALIKFRSVAENEIYGVLVLDVLIIIYILHFVSQRDKSNSNKSFEQ